MTHDWFYAGVEYPGLSKDYQSCRRCGTVRAADGRTDAKSCPGVVRVTHRVALGKEAR